MCSSDLLIIITFLGVIQRYFFNSPFIWGEEVQLALITWTIYFGAAAAFRSGSHIAIDMIVDMFPKKVQRFFDIIIYLVTMYVIYFLTVNSWSLVMQFVNTNRTTNILHIPSQYIYIAIPIGGVLMMISATVHCIRCFINLEEIDSSEETIGEAKEKKSYSENKLKGEKV